MAWLLPTWMLYFCVRTKPLVGNVVGHAPEALGALRRMYPVKLPEDAAVSPIVKLSPKFTFFVPTTAMLEPL
jgi:hypothetical protein